MTNMYRDLVEKLFIKADIRIGGDREFDIQVINDKFFKRVALNGQLGIGESYMNGWWECSRIDIMTSKFITSNLLKSSYSGIQSKVKYWLSQVSAMNMRSKAYEVGKRHYDLGNNLFQAMLDKRMVYSCAYWKDATTLDQAQENKLDLVCRKIGLKPGMKILEIGCGWGGWAKYAAEMYGAEVTGLTISKEQARFAQSYCSGLPVEILLMDYREIKGKFDRVVSIAMFEAVGHKYFRTFMKTVNRCLNDDGLFFLHTIVGNVHLGPYQSPWMNKYIFPNGELPSLAQLSKSVEGLFIEEAHHHFITDYDMTLKAWHDNFVSNWPTIMHSYDEKFFRMWTFYLLISRGIFQSRLIHLWQFVYSKDGISGKLRDSLKENHELFDSR